MTKLEFSTLRSTLVKICGVENIDIQLSNSWIVNKRSSKFGVKFGVSRAITRCSETNAKNPSKRDALSYVYDSIYQDQHY
jgi:hypothetical protein